MNTTRWWWVRHAKVTANNGRLYGASDPPADTDDAEAFAGLARALPRDATWIRTHLQRTAQTVAGIRAAGLDMPEPLVEPAFGEQCFGEWQGVTYTEVAERTADTRHKHWFTLADHQPPGGESFADLFRRVSAAIERRAREHAAPDIVVVAHGGPIRVALGHALGLDPDATLSFSTDNLSLTRIDHVPGPGAGRDWCIKIVNVVPRWPTTPTS